jgi:hypothetical protein
MAISITAWVLSSIVGSYDVLDSSIGTLLTRSAAVETESSSAGIDFIDDHLSECCDGFYGGGSLVIFFVLLSGLPAVFGAWVAALLTRRRRWQWSSGWAPWLQACFVLQLSAAFLAAVVLLAFLPLDWSILQYQAFLVLTIVASLLALPAWRSLTAATKPAGLLTIRG